MSDLSEIVRQWAEAETRLFASERERQIQLALQPKPKWMPTWLWKRAIARLLVVVEHPLGKVTENTPQ